jgi:hypothetical protein
MSAREKLMIYLDVLPEESVERIVEFASFERFNLGIYNKEIKKPISFDDLTEDELNAEIQKGVDSMNAGRVTSSADVKKEMQELYKKHAV